MSLLEKVWILVFSMVGGMPQPNINGLFLEALYGQTVDLDGLGYQSYFVIVVS